jgi:hypothetical protein
VRLLEQSWAEYFGPLNEKLSSGSEPEIFGLKVKGFEWYGTDDLLEKFRSLSASLGISWGEGFSESYVTVKADIEKAHGGPVVFLSAEDFAAVFNFFNNVPPPGDGNPPGGDGNPPLHNADNSRTEASDHKTTFGCERDAEICISKEEASFEVSCDDIGLKVSTTGKVSVVFKGEHGEITVSPLP